MEQIIISGNSYETLIEECSEYTFLTEDFNGKRHHIIEGTFLQADIKNRNGRVYPVEVMRNEVERYHREMIDKNRAVGELGHPTGPTINGDRVSHKILSLIPDGSYKNYIGRARVSNSPYGKIVQNFLEEDIQFGVSSRGLGSLRRTGGVDQVQNDFFLTTAADIVFDPSAPDAYVRGIMENKEYIFADGMVQEANIEKWKNNIKSSSLNNLRETEIKQYHEFLDIITGKYDF